MRVTIFYIWVCLRNLFSYSEKKRISTHGDKCNALFFGPHVQPFCMVKGVSAIWGLLDIYNGLPVYIGNVMSFWGLWRFEDT